MLPDPSSGWGAVGLPQLGFLLVAILLIWSYRNRSGRGGPRNRF